MTNEPSIAELNGFLATHEDPGAQQLFAEGANIGEWKVTGLLGRGGNAEVYRVVRISGTSGTETSVAESVGALKVLHRTDDATRTRFAQEVEHLKDNTSPSLPRFLDAGVVGRSPRDRRNEGRPYLITELLEPVDLPETEKEVSDYLLAVCGAVAALHHAGLIHRDIKPSNIMRRVNGELVLIDLGLVKDVAKSSEPEKDVSIVSSRVVAVGTPRFAAPEQMAGGAITPAADIHALGRLADAAFRSKPPRCWLSIIRRATSSIPEQRYRSVDDLAKAIRRRHWPRIAIVGSAIVVATMTALTFGRAGVPRPPHVDESAAWSSLCKNTTKELISREFLGALPYTNRTGKVISDLPLLAYRYVTNRVNAVGVRLDGLEHAFERPLVLDASREYFIQGPGTLSADIRSKGGEVRLHLKNCFLFNRSTVPIDKAGLRYVFEGGGYLNFTEQNELPRSVVNKHIEDFDYAYDAIRFKGPLTKAELNRERTLEIQGMLLRDVSR